MKVSSSTIVAFMKAVSPETQKVFGFQMAAGPILRAGGDHCEF